MKTISSVESFTGGLFAETITSKPGASEFFFGSLVTYNNSIKEKLGIDVSKGVINKEVALAMALKGREYFKTDICVSFTGNAGPGTMDNHPVGKVFIAVNEDVYELNLIGTREEIRRQGVDFAIKKIALKQL